MKRQGCFNAQGVIKCVIKAIENTKFLSDERNAMFLNPTKQWGDKYSFSYIFTQIGVNVTNLQCLGIMEYTVFMLLQ